jgi:hypothetical protein
MLFMYIHTHTPDDCMVDKPQEGAKRVAALQENFKKANVKVIAWYGANHEHTSYSILEASDLAELEKALIPMTLWGTAKLIPVVPIRATE